MPIPEFNEIKAPALQFFADGKEHHIKEVYESLAKHFALTEEELSQVLPSGRQLRWHNRASWACYDLFRAGLLVKPRRGVYLITEIGKQIAATHPKMIDRDFLMQFPDFAAWQELTEAGRSSEEKALPEATSSSVTPNEIIESAFASLQGTLKSEILELVARIDPYRFEQVVIDLLLAMGYGGSRQEAAMVTQKSNDEGIDGLINEDRLGLDRLYIQAKRWKNTVGRPDIQSFVGALAGQQATKGIFITTSDFTSQAREFVKNLPQRVILIDGDRLAELMIEHNIGVSRSVSYEIKRIDSDYFEEA
jgi:restriction system protein